MIIEMRTYTLQPGTLAEVEKRFGEALPIREKHSKLAAFWHTEVGPLNQIIHVWAYDSFEQRLKVREAAMKEPGWPPPIREFVVAQQNEVFLPAPFSPPLEPRQVGPLFEIRQYTLRRRRDPRPDRALVGEDRGPHKVLPAGRRLALGDRGAQQMGPHLGLQGRRRTLQRAGGRRGHRSVAGPQPARRGDQAGEQLRHAGGLLADPVARLTAVSCRRKRDGGELYETHHDPGAPR